MKLISEQDIPKRFTRMDEWLEKFKHIPEEQALAITQADVDIKLTSVKIVVKRLIDAGKLPNHEVIQRTNGSELTVYIIHRKVVQK